MQCTYIEHCHCHWYFRSLAPKIPGLLTSVDINSAKYLSQVQVLSAPLDKASTLPRDASKYAQMIFWPRHVLRVYVSFERLGLQMQCNAPMLSTATADSVHTRRCSRDC